MFSIKLPVVLYVRVSSDRQKEAHTIQGQIQALKDYCERHEIPISATYQDEGYSGDLPFLQRPGGTQLLTDAKEGKFATVLVFLYDRLSRSVYEGLDAARILKEAGATPYSMMEPFDITTPHGQYMFVNSLNNAELWKAQFLERTKIGSRRKAREGFWMGGSAPYGYRIENKRLAIVDTGEVPGFEKSESDLVRWLFQQVVYANATCYSLARQLNALGVPTKRGMANLKESLSDRRLRGKWQHGTIYHMLISTIYKGECRYGKRNVASGLPADPASIIKQSCPPIISEELWEAAQVKLVKNRIQSRSPTDRRYLLSGLMRCAHCGNTYAGRTHNPSLAQHSQNQQGAYYGCISINKNNIGGKGKEKICSSRTVPGKIESMIWGHIMDFLQNPGDMAEKMAARAVVQISEHDAIQSDIDRLKIARDGLKEERNTVLTLRRKQRIDDEAMDSQLDAIDEEEDALKAEQENAQKRLDQTKNRASITSSVYHVLTTLGEKVRNAGVNAENMPWDEKRYITEQLVAGISVRTELIPNANPAKPGTYIKQLVLMITWQFGTEQDLQEVAIK